MLRTWPYSSSKAGREPPPAVGCARDIDPRASAFRASRRNGSTNAQPRSQEKPPIAVQSETPAQTGKGWAPSGVGQLAHRTCKTLTHLGATCANSSARLHRASPDASLSSIRPTTSKVWAPRPRFSIGQMPGPNSGSTCARVHPAFRIYILQIPLCLCLCLCTCTSTCVSTRCACAWVQKGRSGDPFP